MITSLHHSSSFSSDLFDEDFFDAALGLFLEMQSGHVGKYIYACPPSNGSSEKGRNWSAVGGKDNKGYYLHTADNALLQQALSDLDLFFPRRTNIVDIGVGEISAFHKNILPVIRKIQSPVYYGIDFNQSFLDTIKKEEPFLKDLKIIQNKMDFFFPSTKVITPAPSLGIILCSTIGNIDNPIKEKGISLTLTRSLKTLSHLTKNGWLLVSLDTNHDKKSLEEGYRTPPVERFVLTFLSRIANELPTVGFNPALFRYAPEWHPDIHLFAHMAEATEDQNFTMGAYRLQVKKGQKLHLLNSYKFPAAFFESCCDKANLEVLNVWHHESPMKLYLLIDRANPAYAAQKQKIAAA